MALRTINFGKSYFRSGFDDYVTSFINPALSESIKYDRLAGFFSSSSFIVLAKGLAGLYLNNGKMRLVCGPLINKQDVDAIVNGAKNFQEVINEKMLVAIDEAKDEDAYIYDHARMLGLLISKDLLEIKIAVVMGEDGVPLDSENTGRSGIFHHKVGILEDANGDSISFSGSINETYSAWKKNDEGFKIFRSWIPEQKDYFDSDSQNFYDHWNNMVPGVKIVDLPEAVEKKLFTIAPSDEKEIHDLINKITATRKRPKPHPYQYDAVKKWKLNNYRGIFEMATGTGKTICALECIEQLKKDLSQQDLIIVVACPTNALVEQWADREMPQYGLHPVIASSLGPDWARELQKKVYYQSIDKGILSIATTYATLSQGKLLEILRETKAKKLLICDEAHHAGATEFSTGLQEFFEYRLALTATLNRHGDPEGTELLLSYFGGIQYSFSMERALTEINPITGKTYLCPYRYFFEFVKLTNDEMDEYQKITKKMARASSLAKTMPEMFTALANQRARIVKMAEDKFNALQRIVKKLKNDGKLNKCIIYSPDKEENLILVQNCIADAGGVHGRITMAESADRRQELIEGLKNGEYDIVVAKKILDEGIDVPSIDKAIFMASSRNSAEFIQRRGRILRRSPKKELAEIYDMVVYPGLPKTDPLYVYELKIFERELERVEEFASLSLNKMECLNCIEKVKNELGLI